MCLINNDFHNMQNKQRRVIAGFVVFHQQIVYNNMQYAVFT